MKKILLPAIVACTAFGFITASPVSQASWFSNLVKKIENKIDNAWDQNKQEAYYYVAINVYTKILTTSSYQNIGSQYANSVVPLLNAHGYDSTTAASVASQLTSLYTDVKNMADVLYSHKTAFDWNFSGDSATSCPLNYSTVFNQSITHLNMIEGYISSNNVGKVLSEVNSANADITTYLHGNNVHACSGGLM